MKLASLAAAAAGLSLLASAAGAVTIVNGDFESGPTVGGAGYTTLSAGSSALPGWTIGGDSIDYIGSYWTAESGTHSLDMSGNAPGSISQTVTGLTVGQSYTVTFYLSGNPAGGDPNKELELQAPGITGYYFIVGANEFTLPGITWYKEDLIFQAVSSTANLTFTSLENSAYGPALDNVTISVPELTTWALMIGGLGLVGYSLRRRASRTAIA